MSNKVIHRASSEYNPDIVIFDTQYLGGDLRILSAQGGEESAVWITESRRYDFTFAYMTGMRQAFDASPRRKSVLLIGGAVMALPRNFLRQYPDVTFDVVEIDPIMFELARDYFFLDDVYEKFDPDHTRLIPHVADGRQFVRDEIAAGRHYDVIMLDAFAGLSPVKILATKEALEEFKTLLAPDGVFVANVVGSDTGEKSVFLKSITAATAETFPVTAMLPINDVVDADMTNHILVGSSEPLDLGASVFMPDLTDAVVMHDAEL